MLVACSRNKSSYIEIDESVFSSLLNVPSIQDLKDYKAAIADKTISLNKLKKLARDADVPYPLFFAPLDVLSSQLQCVEKEVINKLPTKQEMSLAVRGRFEYGSIKLIAADLARKQLFLKRIKSRSGRIKKNLIIGALARQYSRGYSFEDIASQARKILGIDIRKDVKRKSDMLAYLVSRAEGCGILVSMSAHNYMPQNLDRNLGISGFCVRDLHFPYIFINTRDGDEEPLIFESAGRKVFTLTSMLVAILIGKLILGTARPNQKEQPDMFNINKIVGMVLIPKDDNRLPLNEIASLHEVKQLADVFKVTPSMALQRLHELGFVHLNNQKIWKQELKNNMPNKQKGGRTDPIRAYRQYNGTYYSNVVVGAYKRGAINQHQFKGALFKHGRADSITMRHFIGSFQV